MTTHIERASEKTLLKLARSFPIVSVTGPRQSGKTMMVRHVLAAIPHVNMEAPEARALALQAPRAFFAKYPDEAVIGDAQKAPELLPWLQTFADESGNMGRYLLTGSQNLSLAKNIFESLPDASPTSRCCHSAGSSIRGIRTRRGRRHSAIFLFSAINI